MTDQTTSPHRVAFTVTVTSRPDGGHYFDRDDFLAHIVQWVKAGLKGKHAIAEVTIAGAPAASSCVPAATLDGPSRRTGLRDQLRRAFCEAEGRFVWGSDMLEPDEYGEQADTALTFLYREWPWLRAEAEDTDLATARATNQRLNHEKQRLESELAAYRRAVAQWEITDTSTYVPLRTLAGIAKAAGLDVPERWELHYQRVERAEGRRADTLREAADWFDRDGRPVQRFFGHQVAALLRRMAAETAQPDTGAPVQQPATGEPR